MIANINLATHNYLCHRKQKEVMPITKNALIRLKYLDRLLSDRHHYYDRKTLTEKVNEMLDADGFKTVDKRTIEMDIIDLMDAPFNAPIKEFKVDGKTIVTYSKDSFSIFREELSREEVNLLREVLSTIGQFEGLNHFEWLDKFKMGLFAVCWIALIALMLFATWNDISRLFGF